MTQDQNEVLIQFWEIQTNPQNQAWYWFTCIPKC